MASDTSPRDTAVAALLIELRQVLAQKPLATESTILHEARIERLTELNAELMLALHDEA